MGEKPTAAWILSLVGGILEIIASLIPLIFMAMTMMALGAATGPTGFVLPVFGVAGTVALAICGWFIIAGIIIILGALKIRTGEPDSVRTGGIMVLIFSILGGNLLALIGAILALTWKPPRRAIDTSPLPPPPPG